MEAFDAVPRVDSARPSQPADAATLTDVSRTAADAMAFDATMPDAGGLYEAGRDVPWPSDVGVDAGRIREATTGPVSLWNGQDLSEWEGDVSIWRVEDGAIVGQTEPDTLTQNSYLIHRSGPFSDFELRLEFWVETGGNSGVQYRSHRVDSTTWLMKGYEADLASAVWGALRDTLGRQLLTRTAAPECVRQIQPDAWNRLVIRARGPTLEHDVNDLMCVRYVDRADAGWSEGYIGLQYHAPGGPTVRFRNLSLTKL